MKKLITALVLSGSLAIGGCTLWDTINPFKSGGKGIDVDTELTVGDKKKGVNTEVSGKKEETHNTADSIVNTYNQIREDTSPWVLILLVLGWILPSPASMWGGVLKLFNRR